MEWSRIVEDTVGVTVGFVAGAVITGRYARLASDELRREARAMRHYVDVLVSYLECLKLDPRMGVDRDETGRITNIRVKSSAASSGRGSSSASGMLQHPRNEGRDVEDAEES